MHVVAIILQTVVATVLIAVWLIRPNQSTGYRGGDAKTMKEEFAVYGLPGWMMYLVGTLKVGAALALLIGIAFPVLVFPASLLIAILMAGALAMHLKIHDPFKKSIPAVVLLSLCAIISFLSRP